MELLHVLELLSISSVNPNDVSKLPDDGKIFESLGVDNDSGIDWWNAFTFVFVMEGLINNFQRANVLALLTFVRIRGIDDHSEKVDHVLRVSPRISKQGILII
jgi:hypothetical protein